MFRSQDSEWDIHTDEIRSIASDELHETRPNRWTGPASTWRKLTIQERQTHAALEGVRNRDLSVHLYNAFALRRRGGDVERGEVAEGSEGEVWAPDRGWTAWPLSLQRVPRPDFMGRDDEDEDTFRRPTSRDSFGVELEEEVSSTILRLAKEKFRTRGMGHRQVHGAAERGDGRRVGEESDVSVAQIKSEPHSGAEKDEAEGTSADSVTGNLSPHLLPAVSIDDDLSYELLRPVTRHVLTHLDKTLTVLHNARVAGVNVEPESEEEQAGGISVEPLRKQSKKDLWFANKVLMSTPAEGETEREMRMRLARKYHRRIPRFSDDDCGATTAAEMGASGTEGQRKKRARMSRDDRATTASTDSDASPERPGPRGRRGDNFTSWALRDWRDVLGAAALAGFSTRVIARATQRCADFFGEEMEFHTLVEEPATGTATRTHLTRFSPGMPVTTDEELEDSEEDCRSEAEQLRAVSRASSVIMDGTSSEDDDPQGGSAEPTRTHSGRRRGRNYSVAPSVVRLYCPHARCSGAINGFSRRYHLRQHLVRVHGKTPDTYSEDEDDEMDEVHGAVHVDGFLKPIRVRKGWRAGDMAVSTKRRQLRGQHRTTRRPGTPSPSQQLFSEARYHSEANADEDTTGRSDDEE